MSTTLPDNYIAYLSVEETFVRPISTLSVIYFTYGIYVLLFGTYIYMMRSRNQLEPGERHNKNLYLILTVVLFVLSTIFVVNETIYFAHSSVVRFIVVRNRDYDLLKQYQGYNDFERRFGSIVAEWMLIHRCYLIWGSNKLVAIPLIMASILINACGLTSYTLKSMGIEPNLTTPSLSTANLFVIVNYLETAYGTASLVNNLIITLLTAGRIWWIHRQVRAQGVYTSDRLVRSIPRFILESGMIYPTIAAINLAFVNIMWIDKCPFQLFSLEVLSAGIAPTLIMVRAKLGKNVESLQEAVSDIRFTSQTAQQGLAGMTTFQDEAQVLSVARNPGVSEGGEEGQVGNLREATVIM